MTAQMPVQRFSTQRRSFLKAAVAGMVAFASAGACAEPVAGATAPVERLNQALLAAMKSGQSAPFADRFHLIAAAVDQAFDLPVILQRSVGLHWHNLSPEQQSQLLAQFRRYTVANYVANFQAYAGETFRTDPSPQLTGPDQVVTTRFGPPDGTLQVLSYVMHETPVGWRATDVLVNGSISRVAVQRSDFRTVLTRGGGPALLSTLQKKVADLSNGAMV